MLFKVIEVFRSATKLEHSLKHICVLFVALFCNTAYSLEPLILNKLPSSITENRSFLQVFNTLETALNIYRSEIGKISIAPQTFPFAEGTFSVQIFSKHFFKNELILQFDIHSESVDFLNLRTENPNLASKIILHLLNRSNVQIPTQMIFESMLTEFSILALGLNRSSEQGHMISFITPEIKNTRLLQKPLVILPGSNMRAEGQIDTASGHIYSKVRALNNVLHGVDYTTQEIRFFSDEEKDAASNELKKLDASHLWKSFSFFTFSFTKEGHVQLVKHRSAAALYSPPAIKNDSMYIANSGASSGQAYEICIGTCADLIEETKDPEVELLLRKVQEFQTRKVERTSRCNAALSALSKILKNIMY